MIVSACSRTVEARTRREQEMYFRNIFDFDAPSAIAEIKYMDVYQRNLMDSVYAQWMRCSYNEEVFQRLLKERGYVPRRSNVFYLDLGGPVMPKWWPDVDESKLAIFVRESDRATNPDQTSFREFLWHDEKTNHMYFHRRYGD